MQDIWRPPLIIGGVAMAAFAAWMTFMVYICIGFERHV
jgi:hypothetical protein